MTEKERLEQAWEYTDEWIVVTTQDTKEDIKKILWKDVDREDIPESYDSWIETARNSWVYRDSKYIYWASEKDIIWAILVEYSYYPWGWCGIEYWVKLFVKRWKETDYRRIKYRDAYSSSWDDWWKAYNEIESIDVKGNNVDVKLKSNSRKDTYSFKLRKNEIKEEKVLSKEDQEKFKEHFEKEKERLLEIETRKNWIMPSNHDLVYMKMPNPQKFNKKYEEAEVIDKSVDLWKWEWYIIIKTQIDSNAADGIQYWWYKYKITPSSTILVEQENAYQSQLMHWKKIDMKI